MSGSARRARPSSRWRTRIAGPSLARRFSSCSLIAGPAACSPTAPGLLQVTTDSQGRAVAKGLRVNNVAGQVPDPGAGLL